MWRADSRGRFSRSITTAGRRLPARGSWFGSTPRAAGAGDPEACTSAQLDHPRDWESVPAADGHLRFWYATGDAAAKKEAEGYAREGKHYATLAVGCTRGKHRSVAIAEELAGRLRADGFDVRVVHRDLGRE